MCVSTGVPVCALMSALGEFVHHHLMCVSVSTGEGMSALHCVGAYVCVYQHEGCVCVNTGGVHACVVMHVCVWHTPHTLHCLCTHAQLQCACTRTSASRWSCHAHGRQLFKSRGVGGHLSTPATRLIPSSGNALRGIVWRVRVCVCVYASTVECVRVHVSTVVHVCMCFVVCIVCAL